MPFLIADGFFRPLCLAQREVSRTSLIIDLRQVVVKLLKWQIINQIFTILFNLAENLIKF